MNKKEIKKEFHKVSIGPILVDCIKKQKDSIKKEGYGVLNVSIYDAGEVLGRKILDNGII